MRWAIQIEFGAVQRRVPGHDSPILCSMNRLKSTLCQLDQIKKAQYLGTRTLKRLSSCAQQNTTSAVANQLTQNFCSSAPPSPTTPRSSSKESAGGSGGSYPGSAVRRVLSGGRVFVR